MENLLCEDLQAGYYRMDGNIKNLKIRVRVRRITNACFRERDSLDIKDPNELELMNLIKASSFFVERTFSWQEKVDKSEENHVGKTDAREQNSDVIVKLFSYQDSDIILLKQRNERPCTSPASQFTELERKIVQIKPRTRLQVHDHETWQRPLFSDVKQILKKQYGIKNESFSFGQSMVIMAVLNFGDSAAEEIELCNLHVDDYGTLTVIPDFHKTKSFTFLSSRSETYEYNLEDVSDNLKIAEIVHEKILLRKIELYKRKVMEDTIGTEFIKPAPDTISFSLNCEIVSASSFCSEDIFVHYLVKIPEGWTSEDSLEGVTERCQSKKKDEKDVAYFGYTFSLNVTTEIKNINTFRVPSLKVVIEVTSVDYWGNFRSEGYGYNDLMLIPGSDTVSIYTWKLEPSTLKNKLRNFFIGGTPCLEDLSYIIDPTEMKNRQLSKYGMCTSSSGSILLKSYVIQQQCIQNT